MIEEINDKFSKKDANKIVQEVKTINGNGIENKDKNPSNELEEILKQDTSKPNAEETQMIAELEQLVSTEINGNNNP